MIRETYGATAITSVATGRTSSSGWSHGCVPGGIGLIAGSKWKTVGRQQDHQQHGHHELRERRQHEHQVGADGVEELLAPQGGVGADRDRDRHRDDRRQHHQHRGVDDARAEHRADRLARGQRGPEVAVQQPAEPAGSTARPWSWSRWSCFCSAASRSGVASRPRIARAGSPSAWVDDEDDDRDQEASPGGRAAPCRTMKPAMPPPRSATSSAAAPSSGEPDGAEPMSEARRGSACPCWAMSPCTFWSSRRSGC